MKVRFEFNIDEVIETTVEPSNNLALFQLPESTGKAFLFIEKATGKMEIVVCMQAADNEHKYPSLSYFYLPPSSVLLKDDEKEEFTLNNVMSVIQECYNNIQNSMIDHANHICQRIDEQAGSDGISEKTLLEALRIVTNLKQD